MAKRLLQYLRQNLSETERLSFEPISKTEVGELFSKHILLEYAVRNWTTHVQMSSLWQNNALQLDIHSKHDFPSTTLLPLLEWACWTLEQSHLAAITKVDIALRVRKATFSDQHSSVVQTLIVYGSLWQQNSEMVQAADCFFQAFTIGQANSTKFHSVTVICTEIFLTITDRMKFSTRTELAARKETMLRYAIDRYRHHHGKTHDMVIQYYKMLAQLYIDIHEEHKAETIWRELREIMITRFGKGSEEEIGVSESLTIVLKKSDKKTDVIEYEEGIFDSITKLEVWNFRRIELSIKLAMSYEARGDFLKAEELYVILWRRLTDECHHPTQHHSVDIHVYLLDVVIEYVRFLRRCNRSEEASNILLCLWFEYEQYNFESETIFIRLRTVGELMAEVSTLSVAISIFKKCLSWFKSHNIHEHVQSCEILISKTTQEITAMLLKTTKTTSTTTELTIKETFESTLSQSIINTETVSICQTLVSHYMSLEQWSQAIESAKKSLLLIWRSIVVRKGTLALPEDFGNGAVDLAMSLAECHRHLHHFHEAQELYVRIYRSCRNSCRVDDDRLGRSFISLINFYQEHRYWHKVIELYKEMLGAYRSKLGASNHLTIRTLYTLGSLSAEHGLGEAHTYYEEIITILNQDSHTCHADALDAMTYMSGYHYEAAHWHKLQAICKILWTAWRFHYHSHKKFTEGVVETLYFRYTYVLEHHAHCELSVLRSLAMEYRDTCHKVFGAQAMITVKAMMELAQICMRSEKYIHEAITVYEEVLKQTKTSSKTIVSTTTITVIQKHLTEAYMSVCSHDSVSTTTVDRAITMVTERYEYLRLTYGWAHSETLASLHEVLLLYRKSKKSEHTAAMASILLEAATQVILNEKHSQILHEAGGTIGRMFGDCGLNDFAREVIHELRFQVIMGKASEHNKHGVKLGKSPGRLVFIFLATVEQVVGGAMSLNYSEVMADYLTESILYESFNRSLGLSPAIIVGYAARLRAFLSSRGRHSQRELIERQSYDSFVEKYALNARSKEIGMLFYISLLVQIGDTIRDIHIGSVASQSSVVEVRRLLGLGQMHKAYEIAECAFAFIESQHSYQELQNVPAGFKLSALLALRGVEQSTISKAEPKIREQMLELSRRIIRGVLQACKDSQIDFVRLQLGELNELIGLLGEQQNYADLEVSTSLSPPIFSPCTLPSPPRRFLETLRFSNPNNPNSGSLNSFGSPAKSKRNGKPTPSSPSGAASSKRATSTPPKGGAPKRSVSVKTYATTCAAPGAPWIPKPSRCPISYPNYTRTWGTTVKRRTCMRTSCVLSSREMTGMIGPSIRWTPKRRCGKWSC